MKELIPTINEIVKYGLESNLIVADRNQLLERDLIKIYSLSFDIVFEFDNTDYPDFDKAQFSNVMENIKSNFKDFEFYKTVLNIGDIYSSDDRGVGDALDDLNDIIFELLETKWRIENNSMSDGLHCFQSMFCNHTKHHILGLLGYLHYRELH